MKLTIVMACATLLATASARLAAGPEDKDPKTTPQSTTQVGAKAPVIEHEVTPKTQVKGPPPLDAELQVKPPSETPTNPNVRQQTMDEKQKAAAQGAIKTKAHTQAAVIHFYSEYIQSPPFLTQHEQFCAGKGESIDVIVRVRYEWQPTTSPQYLPRGAIVVRRTSANERVPVPLARVRGEVSTEQRTDRGEGLSLVRLSLSKADICPISRCLQVRLEAQTPENADRFDTTWRRACVGYSIYPW